VEGAGSCKDTLTSGSSCRYFSAATTATEHLERLFYPTPTCGCNAGDKTPAVRST
jgi:hypothetical protein